ncbi:MULTISPECIES: hypothetical protein [Herpetosiphon]|uniref:hypothetical protein n=1 Tax=Herpetosiphon TaxID=64 RepID=UPI000D7C6CC0|nr:hypothetical protein [Herpetosiphon llansteffanensis]
MAVQSQPIGGLSAIRNRSTSQPTSQRRASVLIALAVVVALMCMLYLAQTGRIAALGFRLEQLEVQQTKLVRANNQLLYEIEQSQSLEVIRQRATALGFAPIVSSQAEYLIIELPHHRWTVQAR